MKLQYNPEKLDELLPYGNDSRFGELTVEGQNQYQKEKKAALRYIKRKVNNEWIIIKPIINLISEYFQQLT